MDRTGWTGVLYSSTGLQMVNKRKNAFLLEVLVTKALNILGVTILPKLTSCLKHVADKGL